MPAPRHYFGALCCHYAVDAMLLIRAMPATPLMPLLMLREMSLIRLLISLMLRFAIATRHVTPSLPILGIR